DWKCSRATSSMRGDRLRGGAVSATEHSARPYTGHIVSGRNPYGAKRRVKRSIVSGLTTSEPLGATRQELRSSPWISSSVTRRAASSKAKFGAGEIVPRCAWIVHSQRDGRERNASGDMRAIGAAK